MRVKAFVAWVLVVGITGVALYGGPILGADNDPYEALKLYDGGWEVKMATLGKKSDNLVNQCSKTGKFFECEQQLNGETVALVVFLPEEKTSSGGQEYRNVALLANGSKPGDWGKIVIEGQTWTYTWTQKDGEKSVPWRNVNHFSDKDHIHFELQSMEDGMNWKTQLSGDEVRMK
jgi:hypothetical protein